MNSRDEILVRVSPEILEHMKAGDLEPVVILGVDERDDGTYDMTLKRAEVGSHPSAPPHRQPCECDACDAWFALPTDDDGLPVASDVAEDKRGLISEPSKCIGCCCPDCKGDPDA